MDKEEVGEFPVSYEPDYENECDCCGQKPVVTAVRKGSAVQHLEMCGPCTWGEAATIDPSEWNK